MSADTHFKVGRFEKLLVKIAPIWAANRIDAQYKAFRYDAAIRSRLRGGSNSPHQQSPNSSGYQSDRIRMLQESRDMAENVPLVTSILGKLADYVAGDVQYQARTGDLDRDALYNDYVYEWGKSCDTSERFSLVELCQLATVSYFRDGDIGFIKTLGDDGRLKLQPIEADRLGNPNQIGSPTDENYIHGITINPKGGKPLSFRIYDRSMNDEYRNPVEIGSDQFLHVFDPSRFDQYRGVSGFHAVLNTLRDIAEIIGFEKASVKWASSITGLITTAGGQASSGDGDFFEQNNASGALERLSSLEPGQLKYLGMNEDVKQLAHSRPTPAWQGFLQLLIREIALGCKMSYGFVYDASGLNGNVARLDSAQAKRTFERHQNILVRKLLDPVRDEVLSDGILRGDLPPCETWKRGKWLFTAHPTMDVGRESQANLAENRQGLKSAADIYAEQGKDVFEEHEQIAIEAANILRLSKKYNVPVAMIQTLAENGRSDAEPIAVMAGQQARRQKDTKPTEQVDAE